MLSASPLVRSVLKKTNHVRLTRVLSQSSANLHRYHSTALVCRKSHSFQLQNIHRSWQTAVLYPTSTCLVKTFHSNVPRMKNSNKKDNEYDIVYRYPYMRVLAAISRFKIAQTTLMVFMVPITVTMAAEGDVSWAAVNTVVGFGIFSTVMLYAMSNYLRKFVGVISINQSGDSVRLSHLNFWGRREELYVDTDNIVPMTETGDREGEMFKKFKVYDSELTMYYTLRLGQITDKEKLGRILGTME
ncbi:TMEM186 [Branchiostoma lanceolatum]|uniref:Transmembrane protein 186 n=1 Tax=Branchiostoma lanceolatum TaxID=7740 RepID=A0A8K0F1R5_BRALA|nr:TMEM186 [Branchiostoma lanceolatum]